MKKFSSTPAKTSTAGNVLSCVQTSYTTLTAVLMCCPRQWGIQSRALQTCLSGHREPSHHCQALVGCSLNAATSLRWGVKESPALNFLAPVSSCGHFPLSVPPKWHILGRVHNPPRLSLQTSWFSSIQRGDSVCEERGRCCGPACSTSPAQERFCRQTVHPYPGPASISC